MAAQDRFTGRRFAGEADLQAITEFFDLCTKADHLDEPFMTVDDWRHHLNRPDLDQERDLRLWTGAAGWLAGIGRTVITEEVSEGEAGKRLTAHMLLRVHPEARGQGLETEIVDWAVARGKQAGQERQMPLVLQALLQHSTPEHVEYRRGVLEGHGFAPVRYWFKMERALGEPVPEPQIPEGFTLSHVKGDADIQKWVEAFNDSFVDHWGFHPETLEDHKFWLQNPKYSAERDLICLAPDGTIAAYCFCWVDLEENALTGRNEGLIETLGTARPYRRKGLGKAMLLAGLQRLRSEGLDIAVLDVDADNPTGALGMYESAGFKKAMRSDTYEREV